MYPFLRMFKELWKYRRAESLPLFATHVSHHRCWPWDIDPWKELNNGRTLTLYDLGRLPFGMRIGLHRVLKAKGWGLTVAGSSIRYRRRVTVFDRLEMRTRLLGWDSRFFYVEQSMWKGAECTSQVLIRSAVFAKTGIVDPSLAIADMGHATDSPPLPAWVQGWIAGDALRPWPPER